MPVLPGTLDFSELGGELQDFTPKVDPDFDRSAAEVNAAFAAVAGMTRTAIRAIAECHYDGYGPVVAKHNAVWGNSVAPTFARTAAGTYTLTYPSTVTDALGDAQAVNFFSAFTSYAGIAARIFSVAVTTPNVITIYSFNTSGALTDMVENLTVFGV